MPDHMGTMLWQFHGVAAGRRTCTAVHVHESVTLGNCHSVAPHGPTPVFIMSMHVSHVKLPQGGYDKRQNRSVGYCQKWKNRWDNVVATGITIDNPINYY